MYLTGICALLSAARLIGSTALSIVALHRLQLTDYVLRFGWLLTSIIAVTVTNDVLLAVFLTYCLSHHKSRTYTEISRVIDKLIVVVVESGAITSIGAVALLACFLTMPFNTIYMAFFVILGKLYSNALLASLNARKRFSRLFGEALPLQGIDRPGSSPIGLGSNSTDNHWTRSPRAFSLSQIIPSTILSSNRSRQSTTFEMMSPLEPTYKVSNRGIDHITVTTRVEKFTEEGPLTPVTASTV
ncbi:hypothetical protein K435DRAFT_963595 [Dendrothele bispora CBS 962.96]|uniref:DUF6534 domain-containing protein n=1 Tax=Dendrothele bispora (strain CBS 962.96) TaxID=1314807 RepID=A0A4S8MF32_DENBC|nr:hypothetical protein K435DRAFT_963595 [Dendrothele bispora CBS 962.96]